MEIGYGDMSETAVNKHYFAGTDSRHAGCSFWPKTLELDELCRRSLFRGKEKWVWRGRGGGEGRESKIVLQNSLLFLFLFLSLVSSKRTLYCAVGRGGGEVG